MLSRPVFGPVLPSKPRRKHETKADDHAFAGLGWDGISGSARESMAPVLWRRGYTLFEMIIVCALLLIVAGLSIPSIESMYSDSKMQAAVDQVRGAWASARSHAISEGQSYRFSESINGTDFRVAPEGSEYWGGGDAPAATDPNNPPLVTQASLPSQISFTADASDPGSADPSTPPSSVPSGSGGAWTTVAVFLPDGTAQQDVEIIFRLPEAGATPISLKLRALTGGMTTRRLSAAGH